MRAILALFLFALPLKSFAYVPAAKLAYGIDFACAVTAEKRLACWGNNKAVLSKTPALNEVTDVAAFARHACAVAGGRVHCWGDNSLGQTNVPAGLENVVSVSVGKAYSCAATREVVTCWGNSFPKFGELFSRKFTDIKSIAVEPNGSLQGSYWHLCLLDGAKVECFSQNAQEQITPPGDLAEVSEIKVGMSSACALSAKGWRCWGDKGWYEDILRYTDQYELGDFELKMYHRGELCRVLNGRVSCRNGQNAPADMVGVVRVVVGTADEGGCAITGEGVRCWGPAYQQALAYPIPAELQAIAPRLNEGEISSFLGCYSEGFKLVKEISPREVHVDGSPVEQLRLNKTVWGGSAFDDEIKVIPGQELLVRSLTAKVKKGSGNRSEEMHYLRVFKKRDGTFAISTAYGSVWNLSKEECR